MAYEGGDLERSGLGFGPAPKGFDMSPFDAGDRDVAALSERGCCYLLSDTRVDLTGPARVYSSRLVQQVTGGDGLQSAASFEVPFNPAYERLVIHTVRVIRAGQTREAAEPAAFELLRRELNLERAMYDGRITAHMIVPDLRVGDIVDSAFSVIGSNPVLKGALSFRARLQWGSPTIESRFALRIAASRRLAIRTTGVVPAPLDRTGAGVRSLDWRLTDAPTYRHETDAPAWYVGYASVHVADDVTWPAVGDLFRDFYTPPVALPADLNAAIDAIAETHASAQARAPAALRFVQGLLRYHSVGVGEGGYRPRPVDQIWASRYGDCKDASRLFMTVLRRLGVDAWPVLVNTRTGAVLDKEMPNATAFDHCIVGAKIDGDHWWFDPTMSAQAGDLLHLTAPDYFHGLPLVEGATLQAMPPRSTMTVCHTVEEWTFPMLVADPARLALRTTYRDWRADDMRRWIENDGLSNVARRMREGLEEEYGELVEIEPLKVIDDDVSNTLALVELYDVSRPLQPVSDDSMRFLSRDDVVSPALRNLESARRLEPIALGTPRRLETKRVFNFPVAFHLSPWSITESGPAATLTTDLARPTELKAVHRLCLTVTERVVEPDRAQGHFAFMRRARENNGITFLVPIHKGRFGATRSNTDWGLWVWLGLIGLVVASVILGQT